MPVEVYNKNEGYNPSNRKQQREGYIFMGRTAFTEVWNQGYSGDIAEEQDKKTGEDQERESNLKEKWNKWRKVKWRQRGKKKYNANK